LRPLGSTGSITLFEPELGPGVGVGVGIGIGVGDRLVEG
jgi:hypothetical protein